MHLTSLKVSVLSIATLKIWLNQISVVNLYPSDPPAAYHGASASVAVQLLHH